MQENEKLPDSTSGDIDRIVNGIANFTVIAPKPPAIPTAEELGDPTNMASIIPATVGAFMGGIRHLMSLDERIVRSCIVLESDSPLNLALNLGGFQGNVILSFAILEIAGMEPTFLNFGLDMEQDLSSVSSLYETIRNMEVQLRDYLSIPDSEDGTPATDGEDQ